MAESTTFYMISSSEYFLNKTIVTRSEKDDIKIMATYYMMYKVGKISYYLFIIIFAAENTMDNA